MPKMCGLTATAEGLASEEVVFQSLSECPDLVLVSYGAREFDGGSAYRAGKCCTGTIPGKDSLNFVAYAGPVYYDHGERMQFVLYADGFVENGWIGVVTEHADDDVVYHRHDNSRLTLRPGELHRIQTRRK